MYSWCLGQQLPFRKDSKTPSSFRPLQPHPAALQHIAQHWGIEPEELVMIGDSAKDDVRILLRRMGS